MTDGKKTVKEAIKFAFIGVINTVLDWVLFWVFLSALGFNKNISQILATALAMCNSYLLNRYFTFKKTGSVKLSEISKFILVNLLSLLVNLLCLNLFCDVFKVYLWANSIFDFVGIDFMLSGDTAIMFSKLCAVPFSLLVNFIGNKLWVFGKKEGNL